MNIKGFMKTSLIDYPGKIATTVFVGGCNFRCPYCHNGDLVLQSNDLYTYDEKEIFNYIDKRKNILDGICITGGEPTLYKDLPQFIKKVKEQNSNILIKLDTNGTNPEMLAELLDKNYLDYVAMDIKNSPAKYSLTAGINDCSPDESKDLKNIYTSVNLLLNSNIDYEFRTTVVRELHEEKDFYEIGEWIKGAKHYYLQQFKEAEKQIQTGFSAYEPNDLMRFQEIMQEYVNVVKIRGI